MPDTEFRSYYMLFYNTNPQRGRPSDDDQGYLDEFGTKYIVLNRTSRLFLERLIPRDKVELAAYMSGSGERVAYFDRRVLRVHRGLENRPQQEAALIDAPRSACNDPAASTSRAHRC